MPEGPEDWPSLVGRQFRKTHTLVPASADQIRPASGSGVLDPGQPLAGDDLALAVERHQRHRGAARPARLSSRDGQDVLGADAKTEPQRQDVETAGGSQPPRKRVA